MGSKTDKIKGRIKEVVGALTDNDHLKREGRCCRQRHRLGSGPTRCGWEPM